MEETNSWWQGWGRRGWGSYKSRQRKVIGSGKNEEVGGDEMIENNSLKENGWRTYRSIRISRKHRI